MQPSGKNGNILSLTLLTVTCLIGGVLFAYLATKSDSTQRMADQFSTNLEHQLAALNRAAAQVSQQGANSGRYRLERVDDVDFFIINNREIEQWTGAQYLPGARLAWDDFEMRHIKTGAGDFLLRKWPLERERFLVAIIPLHIHYRIQNEYLTPRWNTRIFAKHIVEIIDANAVDGNPVTVQGTILFKFKLLSDSGSDNRYGILAVLLFSSFLIVLLVLFLRLTKPIHARHPAYMFLMVAGMIVGIRVLMIAFEFPARFAGGILFDAKYFASSYLNPSLGDLFLNSLAVTWICLYLFRNFYRFEGLRSSLRVGSAKWGLSVFSALAILFSVLLPFVVIQTIYNNSGITLNISESIQFDSLRLLAFVSLVLAWLSSFLFIHVFVRLLMSDRNLLRIVISALIGLLLFVFINTLSGQLYWSSLIIGLGYGILVVVFKLYKSLQHIGYGSFVYFFLTVIAFSANCLVAVSHYSNSRKAQDQARFASAFLIDRDDFGEFLLDEASRKISADLFIQTRLSGPFASKEAVRQKVRQIFIPGYFNKYNLEVHLFGPTGESLDESHPSNVAVLLETIERTSTQTGYDNIYFISRPDSESARKYLVVIPIKRYELSAGHIVLELTLKRIIPDNVYPELLVDNRFQQAYRSQEFSYAIFLNNEVQFRAGDFNYGSNPVLLNDPQLFDRGAKAQGYLHIGSGNLGGRVVVVSSPLPSRIFRLADFSFFVLLGLGVIMAYLLVIGGLDFLKHERLMMATRIQLILNLSFFVPLIAVSITTLGLTAKSNQEQLNTEYLAKSRNFGNELSSLLTESPLPDGITYEQNFSQLSKMSNLDANLFSPTGRLQLTTQPMIFENQLLAPFINPVALRRIRLGDGVFVTGEEVGSLKYFAAYSALYSPDDGRLIGIASIPFFQSAYLLEKMQITVLANILFIFTAIFVLLLVVSYGVSKWLTFPLRMITQKLGRISLTHSNQPLEWQSEDEIGLMVKEYNQMLSTLAESKMELERTQRERAWREIAQQVAHEIKNPLTPMKLTLQKLERLSEDDPKKFEKLQKSIASLLSQVNTLDGVASSFSTFAKMPEPVMQEVELIGLLKGIMTLHSQTTTIEFESSIDRLIVRADEQLLGRIFSNVLLNSIQASHRDRPLKIHIQLQLMDKLVRITMADNGTGIEDSMKDKIFLPHFSTKQSGSGLGLAIAKQGIEQMGGHIHFESTLGKGTVFYVDLPYQDELSVE
jgi:two-component system, NtrC family, nitrogen regulation sensor histidine kinase NtrY